MASFTSKLEQCWYGGGSWSLVLLPLAWLFQLLSFCRKKYYTARTQTPAPVPVIVIGNITVGGTGKTPLIIALTKELTQRGFKPGIISRGYGSQATEFPVSVDVNTSVLKSGDEALLIAKSSHCPVVISPNRTEALDFLLKRHNCDVVLSDDGLQHYRLARTIEIAVVDGNRGVGNGWCLPVGPLRESPSRLNTVDFVVVNGVLQKPTAIPKNYTAMTLKTALWRRVVDDSEGELQHLSSFDQVHALTGIGNPQRFYRSLRESNIELKEHTFPDHYNFQLADIIFPDDLPIVMTAKDAVKCRELLNNSELSEAEQRRYWYLPIVAQLPGGFYQDLFAALDLPLNSRTALVTD